MTMTLIAALLGLAATMSTGSAASADDAPRGRMVMPVEIGGTAPLPVHLYAPERAGPDAPIVLVMHGARRNADDYRDNWIDVARGCDVIIAAPEFSQERFPGSARYNLGGLGGAGEEPPAFDVIGTIFEAVQAAYAPETDHFVMFGHSAGSQFVHRFAVFGPDPRLRRAVAANAGWYTTPDPRIAWPYGLGGAPAAPLSLAEIRALPLALHLGEEDNDPDANLLRRTPQALAQGAGRYDRGLHMASLTGWPVTRVTGVGHNNALMVPAAARDLLAGQVANNPRCRRATRRR